MYKVKIIADSIYNGNRITTMQLTYPRYIHAEFMTHRVFSRNASSSRAIPSKKLIKDSLDNMVFPIRWGKNQAGMQASMEELEPENRQMAEEIWRTTAEACAKSAQLLTDLGLHKQWANRMLEWFGTISVIVTATEWENFFELRNHPDAQPEIRNLAVMMEEAMERSFPDELAFGDWHLPYISDEEKHKYAIYDLRKLSVARCARVSYLTHDGQVPEFEKDIQLYERLVGSEPLHASPTEHQATPSTDVEENHLWGNFRDWVQFRKLLENDIAECLYI